MKNLILATGVFFLLTSNFPTERNVLAEVTTVHICNSKNSTKYHYKKNCRGLNACKAPIKEIALADAKKRGRTLCGWED